MLNEWQMCKEVKSAELDFDRLKSVLKRFERTICLKKTPHKT